MILVIDNYDSFVHNIARYFECAGEACTVVRNDKITVQEAEKIDPLAIVISPGPCTPKEAGVSVELVKKLGAFTPVFGICLGHQCIGEAFGAKTVRTKPVHGHASAVTHDGSGIFAGLPGTLNAGRYHSLATELQSGSPLRVTAQTDDGIIMAMQHGAQPVYGVQFHPESILTDHGAEMIGNFTAIARRWRENRKIAA
ncbi:MAG: aminodeoxychorismate/anthranilate synthase component II [Alphaproteobacteria bacterium]